MSDRIVVIIPTYNEGASIGHVIDALEEEIGLIIDHEISILIVDGNSSDNTIETVRQKQMLYKNIDLIIEKQKRGLGMAYITGMRYAMNTLKADAFIEFDGDFQHDPRDIKRMIEAYDEGFDYVIGSRYVRGGSVPATWSWYRKLLSRIGGLFARIILRLPTYDNTSGFKLSRVRRFAENLPLNEEQILSKRHAYKIHLLYEMIAMGATVKEVPIAFLNRSQGDSKSTLEDIKESLKVVLLLWYRKQ